MRFGFFSLVGCIWIRWRGGIVFWQMKWEVIYASKRISIFFFFIYICENINIMFCCLFVYIPVLPLLSLGLFREIQYLLESVGGLLLILNFGIEIL